MLSRSLLKASLICVGLTIGLSAAEAMPVASSLAPIAGASIGGAQVEKTVVIVRRRVFVRRPLLRRRPFVRRIIRRL